MIFEPYADELKIINNIHKYNENEYVVIRLTNTMIDKNNIDANALLRDLLKSYNLVDYDLLENGGNKGRKFKAKLILNNNIDEIIMNFYRVKNSRGDRRFSIYKLGKFASEKNIRDGDLLYITINSSMNTPEIIVMNVSNSIPSESLLSNLFDGDKIESSLSRLLPLIREISRKGFHSNSKGPGKASPKDAGDTLESLLGMKANNSTLADFENNIELKTKIGNKTLDTLFTLRPHFENTPVAKVELNDRSRVNAYTRMYGYDSEKYIGSKTLFITIGTEDAPQNTKGFFLNVNEDERKVELKKKIEDNKSILTGYWSFEELDEKLQQKHPATLWISTEKRVVENFAQFKYFKAVLSRSPQFTTFLSLIKTGGITYDWRGYTSIEGKYEGKNHGNAWRIKNKQKVLLFGSMRSIDLQ